MLLKFGGPCSICKQHIPAGKEARYDGEAKTIAHWECFENPTPGPEAFALAERLGFVPHADALAIDWIRICEQWSAMRVLPSADRGDVTRRAGSARGQQSSGIIYFTP